MKQKIPYNYFSIALLRTPLFPIQYLDIIFNDQINIYDNLKDIFDSNVVGEAIYLASPSLHKELKSYFHENTMKGSNYDRCVFAFLKYLIRMSCRPTPFGLFAGVSSGKMDKGTDIILSEMANYKRHTRLDMNYMCALANDLVRIPEIREKLLFYPNTSLYSAGSKFRYVEYRYHKLKRTHHLVSINRNEYLEKIITMASRGVCLNDLRMLMFELDITEEDGKEYLNELVNGQILVSELEPALCGPEFLDQILIVLKRISFDQPVFHLLKAVRVALGRIDKNGIGNNVSVYHNIKNKLNQFGTPVDERFLFQVDMIKPVDSFAIDKKIVADTLKGIEVLKKLSGTNPISRLEGFRRKFNERYEEREVSLLEALDEDIGTGYGIAYGDGGINPLVDNIVFPAKVKGTDIFWDNRQSFYLHKYHQALKNGSFEVVIEDKDLAIFNCRWDDLPDTFAAMVKLIKNNDRTDIILERIGGAGAANLAGRFCHADPEVEQFVKEICDREQALTNDGLLAEIVHLPQSRTANILQRPILRNYEITYLGNSVLPKSGQIRPDDLFVSVKNNKFYLRSKRLNKYIKPRLSTAHNYSNNSLAVYRFLCDLQMQDKAASAGFDWGAHNNEFKFMPRVRYRNMILSLAKWNLLKSDIKQFFKISEDHELLNKIDNWRDNEKLPQRVLLCENDNELLIDFNSAISIRLLFSIVKNRAGFQLKEFIFNESNSIVHSKEGSFSNEIILSFYRDNNLNNTNG